MIAKHILLASLLLTFIFMKNTTVAQDREKTKEEIELKTKAEIAKLKEEIAESEKKTMEAIKNMYAGPEVSKLSGKIESEGTLIETKVLAQKSLLKTMDSLVENLTKIFTKKDEFVILNKTDLEGVELYVSMLDQVNSLENALNISNQNAQNWLKKDIVSLEAQSLGSPLAVGYAVAGMLRTAADIVSLFKTESKIETSDITVDDISIAAAFKKALFSKADSLKVFQPSLYPINTIKRGPGLSTFIEDMNDVQKEINNADNHLSEIQLKIDDLNKSLASETDDSKKEIIKKLINGLSSASEELNFLKKSFEQLQSILSVTDQSTKMTAQSEIMRAERLHTLLNKTDVYAIRFQITSKGSTKIKQSNWRSAKIEYSAGTELNCLIFNSAGEVVYAETSYEYIPYDDSKIIK